MADLTIGHVKARVIAVVAALVMVLGIGMVAAPTASAAKSQCPSGHGCSWNNTNYGGAEFVRFEFNVPNYAAWSGYDNSVSSVYSRGTASNCRAHFYPNANYKYTPGLGVRTLRLAPGQEDSNLGNNVLYTLEGSVVAMWNDKISSARFEKASNQKWEPC